MTLTELKYIVAVIVRRRGRGAPRSGDRPRSAIVAAATCGACQNCEARA
ncbi:MAG: hypothetical protein R3E52_11170 [Burkholderiaceae bacterium]